jgi:hypothetical protein
VRTTVTIVTATTVVWMSELQAALDPAGLLNPGKVFRPASVADLDAAGRIAGR